MAYRSIDDAAWTTTDSGPLASAHSVTLRDNLAQCSAERAAHAGIVFPASEPLRLCSFFDACAGPFFIYCPPEEDIETLSVVVEVSDVEFMGGGYAGTPAASLYATIGTTARFIDRPPDQLIPGDVDPWLTLDQGDSGSYALPLSTIDMANANKVSGWVPVFIWIRSKAEPTAEDTGSIDGANGRNNSIKLDAAPSPTPSTPPERIIVVNPKAEDADNVGYADDVYQWCAYRDDNSEEWAELAPLLPYSGYVSPSASWASYRLGVVLIESISIKATPAAFEPSAAAFYSGEPAAEQWLSLAQRTNRLINQRTRQWSCNPGPDSYSDGAYSRPWPIRAGDSGGTAYAGADPLDTDWQDLAGALIVAAPPDDNGYEGIVSLMLLRRWVPDLTAAFPGDLELRLAAYSAGVASPVFDVAGESHVITAEQLGETTRNYDSIFSVPGYSPARQSIARSNVLVDWQLRGMLGSHDLRSGTGTHDWALVSNIELPPLPVAGLTYPLRVVIQGQLTAAYSVLTTAVIGAGIRSRDKA